MGVCNYLEIFQGERTNYSRFSNICVYLDDQLVLTNGDWNYNLTKFEKVLIKLQEKGEILVFPMKIGV